MPSLSANVAVQETAAPQRARVLLLCWGESIHARRRVQLFIDDPRFEVAVVSTFDYQFEGVRFFPLLAARAGKAASQVNTKPRLRWLSTEVREFLAKVRRIALLPWELVRFARDLSTLRRAVRDFRPDLIFLQTLHYPCYLAYLLPRSVLMAVTFWNGDVTHSARWSGLEILAKQWLVRYGVRRADQITVNSGLAFDACVRLGARKEKVSLIRYPATDIEMFARRHGERARRRLSIRSSHVVLCPRGLGRFFNSETIVESMPAVLAKFPDALFLFVSGVGGELEWSRHLDRGRALGVAERMRWDGRVPWGEMPWYYSASDVMLSIMTADSCPNCMLEAMAAEVPVVMSDTPQNREWIENGQNGFLIQPQEPGELADRVLELLEDRSDLSRRFTQRCLEQVKANGNARINVPRIKDLVLQLVQRDRG